MIKDPIDGVVIGATMFHTLLDRAISRESKAIANWRDKLVFLANAGMILS